MSTQATKSSIPYNYNRNYFRALTPYELKTVSEIDVWYEYLRLKSHSGTNVALQELLSRHDTLLKNVARSFHNRYNLISELDDKIQHAQYAALRCYDKFDVDKARESGARLSTYVCSCVHKHLLSSNDADSFIDCPTGRRMTRSYLSGGYDTNPLKKSQVEQRLKIHRPEDVDELFQKYSSLLSSYVSIDGSPLNSNSNNGGGTYSEIIPDITLEQADDIANRIQISKHMDNLSINQREILTLFSKGFKLSEIGQILGVDITEVQKNLRTIRATMKRILESEKNEESALMSQI